MDIKHFFYFLSCCSLSQSQLLIHTHSHINSQTQMYTYIHIHTHTLTHTLTNTHTHTLTHIHMDWYPAVSAENTPPSSTMKITPSYSSIWGLHLERRFACVFLLFTFGTKVCMRVFTFHIRNEGLHARFYFSMISFLYVYTN